MSVRRGIRVRAFAKINLTLRVLGVRTDRYHELRTTFQSIALHDTLTFTAVPGPFRIECDDPACPSDRTNLIWHAAERMCRAASRGGVPRDVVVRVAKRIPMQAGLGGGSSDAASTLVALDALWRVRMSREKMRSIASEVGADVPFFLEGGTALGLERGDLLFPLLDAPASWVVLAIPDFGVSTSEAYGWLDRDRRAAGLRRALEPRRVRRGGHPSRRPRPARAPDRQAPSSGGVLPAVGARAARAGRDAGRPRS